MGGGGGAETAAVDVAGTGNVLCSIMLIRAKFIGSTASLVRESINKFSRHIGHFSILLEHIEQTA